MFRVFIIGHYLIIRGSLYCKEQSALLIIHQYKFQLHFKKTFTEKPRKMFDYIPESLNQPSGHIKLIMEEGYTLNY